jgi:hypothetical protein
MAVPKITTAVPKARWSFGHYQVVALGEIESPDPVRYRFILAFVRSGAAGPSFYVTSVKNPAARAEQGSHRLCVVSESHEEEIESSDRFADLETFSAEGLKVAAERLEILGEPERLM